MARRPAARPGPSARRPGSAAAADLAQRDRALGDVGRVVADTLDVGRDAQAGEDLAQVARHRPAQGQADDVVADLVFERVDGFVVGDARSRRLVALDDVDGRVELDDGHLAHAHEFATRRCCSSSKLLTMWSEPVHGLHLGKALDGGDDVARQPKRPVM
jgi:hypothetical protein